MLLCRLSVENILFFFEYRGQTDRFTNLANATYTLLLDLDFQSSASCDHDPYTLQKIKVKLKVRRLK